MTGVTRASLKRILLATDLEPKSDRALERAVQLARRFDAELTALHVVDGNGGRYGCLPLHHVESELQRHILAASDGAGIRAQAVAVRGDAVEHRVAGYAGLWRPDLLVVGLHQRDRVADLFLASTVERIAIADGTPMLIVRDKPLQPYLRALVPVDFSERSRPSVEGARMLMREGCIHLLHVTDLPETSALDKAQVEHDFRTVLGIPGDEPPDGPVVETILLAGSPARQIVDLARQGRYDLVAIGSVRRSGVFRALLGSTASEVIDVLPCDVLIGGVGACRPLVPASPFWP
ncbi:nucleotide-binding universal stress UspA family protein [Azospirillum lipoferum]|uniref:Universal stress protein n=1 Tax=Azospirillum lipoferum TaxID=193 RepID=A0A5A9GKS2_AZOLI|nr:MULTISPECIES: universal stress protein [Azospirillum]KAA0594352.1 universal stress protein [Azospirillum lipoferum]MCP1613083.1 nucleotide-binding universal stress UspA family protein [Azospirillum lipoferum]MDW5531283.1 universal stress protein [Azospirillum sp. NL1]